MRGARRDRRPLRGDARLVNGLPGRLASRPATRHRDRARWPGRFPAHRQCCARRNAFRGLRDGPACRRGEHEAALAAGATAIGNLGQYFTFRLPYWDDDVATTEATLVALGLIAAQDVEVLVHSNLDDGFAGLFADVSSALGMVLVEKYIVEDLIGGRVSHCYGHHFTSPLIRLAFHQALTKVSDTIGTMIFGSTVSYRSTPAANYASLASYLQADVWALQPPERTRDQPGARHGERAHPRHRRDRRCADFRGPARRAYPRCGAPC